MLSTKLGVLLTPLLSLWRGISAKCTRRLPQGTLICPAHGDNNEICLPTDTVQKGMEGEEKPLLLSLHTLFWALAPGKASIGAVSAQRNRGLQTPQYTHPAVLGPPRTSPHGQGFPSSCPSSQCCLPDTQLGRFS